MAAAPVDPSTDESTGSSTDSSTGWSTDPSTGAPTDEPTGSSTERSTDPAADSSTGSNANEYHPYAGRRAMEGRERPGRESVTPPGTEDHEVPGKAVGQSSSRPQLNGREKANQHPQKPHKTSDSREKSHESRATEGTVTSGAAETTASSADTPDSDTKAAQEGGREPIANPGGPMVRVLPIGAGLTLMGLGLGAIGLRLRRH